MPMLFALLEPDDVTRANFLDRIADALNPTAIPPSRSGPDREDGCDALAAAALLS
jgi:hypothetical protein